MQIDSEIEEVGSLNAKSVVSFLRNNSHTKEELEIIINRLLLDHQMLGYQRALRVVEHNNNKVNCASQKARTKRVNVIANEIMELISEKESKASP